MTGVRSLLPPALLATAPFVPIARLDDPIARYPTLLAWLAVATAGWLWGWRRAAGRTAGPAATPGGPSSRGSGASLALVLGVALAIRSLLLVPAASLSDDLYRYLWDGRVANAGLHPFAHAPAAPELEALRDETVWPRINHPEIPTIYPPTAQLLFRALDAGGAGPRAVRSVLAAIDVLGVVLLAALLRRRGRPPELALALGWCPLAALETAGGGHVDALGATLLVGALLAVEASRPLGAGLALGLAALVKPVVAFPLPALVRGLPTARARAALLVGVALAMLLIVPYLGAGERLFAGFRAYAEHWRFNDAVYGGLVGLGLSPVAARAVLGLVLLGAAGIAAARVPRRLDPLAAAGAVVLALLFLSPTVHPWYGLWLVPLLPFLPRSLFPGGVALVALLPVSYAAAWHRTAHGAWMEPGWSRAVVWGAPAALTLLALARARFRRSTPPGPDGAIRGGG